MIDIHTHFIPPEFVGDARAGRALLAASGLNITSAASLDEAAATAVELARP